MIGKYIAEHRNKKQLSIRKLAELANVSHTEIYRIENGKRNSPSPFILKALSGPLDVQYIDIMKVAGYIDEDSPDVALETKIDVEGLTDNEIEEVKNFINFLRSKK